MGACVQGRARGARHMRVRGACPRACLQAWMCTGTCMRVCARVFSVIALAWACACVHACLSVCVRTRACTCGVCACASEPALHLLPAECLLEPGPLT